MPMELESPSCFPNHAAFSSPGIGASSFLMTMSHKRCRQRQGATSRKRSDNMMLLRRGAAATAAATLHNARVPWRGTSPGGGVNKGVQIGAAGERRHDDRLFMFLGQKSMLSSAGRDSGAETGATTQAAAAASAEAAVHATADDRCMDARKNDGREAATQLPKPRKQPQRDGSRGSSSSISISSSRQPVPRTGLPPPSDSERHHRPNGDPLLLRSSSSSRAPKTTTTVATTDGDDGDISFAGASNAALFGGASRNSSRGSSSGGEAAAEQESEAGSSTRSSGRARRQRDRRRRERATMAAKKSLVKKVKGLGDAGQWRQAMSEVESAVEGGLPADQYVYGSCVGAAANSGRWEEALDILHRMRQDGVVPTTPVYNAAIKACSRGGQLELALALLEEMRFNSAKASAAAAAGTKAGASAIAGAPAIGNSRSGGKTGGSWKSRRPAGSGAALAGLDREREGAGGEEGSSSGSRFKRVGDGVGGSRSSTSSSSSRRGRRQAAPPTPSCDPDIQTINTVMSVCADAGRWELALEVMEKAQREDGLHPTRVTYNTAISACGRGGEADQAVRLLRAMRVDGLVPNVVSFNSTIAACAVRGQWKRALSLLAEMEATASDGAGEEGRTGLSPDVYSFSSAIAACGRGGQWSLAAGLLSTMRRKGVAPGVVAFNAAISACGKAGQWERALGLLRDMEAEAKERRREGEGRTGGDGGFSGPDRVSYNAAINACSNAGEWQQAVSLLAEMRRNAVLAGAAAGGIDNGKEDDTEELGRRDTQRQRRRSRGRAGGPTPDVVSYSTAITACSRAGNWERALEVLQQMLEDGVEPNSATFTTMIAAWRKDWGYGSGEGAGGQEARSTLLPLLDSMGSCGFTPDKRLYGSALDACGDASLCQRARALLAEMVASGIPADGAAQSAVATACAAVGSPSPRQRVNPKGD